MDRPPGRGAGRLGGLRRDPARRDWLLGVASRADPDTLARPGARPGGLERWEGPGRAGGGGATGGAARTAAAGAGRTAVRDRGRRGRLSERVQEQYPEDFWANFTLALALHGAGRRSGGDPTPAIAYYEKALEIRPEAVAVLNDFGVVLYDRYWMWDNDPKGRGGAITVFHQVVKNDPRCAAGFNNLGMALKAKGDWGVAVLLYRDALEIDPRLAPAHCNLGEILAGSGPLNEAIDHYRQALQIDPDCARAHHLLGVALLAKGRRDEVDDCYPEGVNALGPFRTDARARAIAYYLQAHYIDPEWTPAWNTLRIPPQDEARLKEAIDHFRQAVRLEPQFALAHGALGQALLARREFTEAEAEIRRSLDLVSEGEKKLRANLERLLQRCQRLRTLWKVVSPPSSRERTGPPPPTAVTWRNSVSSRSTTPRPLASMPRRSQPHPN